MFRASCYIIKGVYWRSVLTNRNLANFTGNQTQQRQMSSEYKYILSLGRRRRQSPCLPYGRNGHVFHVVAVWRHQRNFPHCHAPNKPHTYVCRLLSLIVRFCLYWRGLRVVGFCYLRQCESLDLWNDDGRIPRFLFCICPKLFIIAQSGIPMQQNLFV